MGLDNTAPELGKFRDEDYADKAQENAIGSIKFASVSRTKVADVQEMVNAIGVQLDTKPPTVASPKNGLLAEPLTSEARQQLNAFLGQKYASRTLQQQQEIASISIEERGDNMVSLPAAFAQYGAQYELSDRKFEQYCGPYAGKPRILYLRAAVANKVADVCKALNAVNLQTRVYDCFRPEAVQATLFIRRLVTIAQQEKRWSSTQVMEAAKSLTAYSPGCAGHQAGSAIDLRLQRIRKGDSWKPDLGNSYPEGGAVSSIDFPYLTYDQWKTRVLFEGAMSMGGLRLLRSEDWHASFGDRGMGLDGDVHQAIFGPLKSFNEETGEIEEWYDENEIDEPYLSQEDMESAIIIARKNRGIRTACDLTLRYMQQQTNTQNKQRRVQSWIGNN